jgi:catechol 2,3-dioxygenase-like lactoylglutathione lyase family enzyme
MLRERPIHATIPAADLERARAFYADKLGLIPAREEPAGLVYETPGGAWFRLYWTPYAGTARCGVLQSSLLARVRCRATSPTPTRTFGADPQPWLIW